MILINALRNGLEKFLELLGPGGGPVQVDMRTRIAADFLKGSGVEFGALHSPLSVPAGVTVKYADFQTIDQLKLSFPDLPSIRSPDYVTDLESMSAIGDASQDFVIANHVLEHVEDPLKALGSMARVLRSKGIAYIALPDKRFTFDKDRVLTPLDHLLRDHREGPDWSLAGHYEEWCRCVDGLSGSEHAQKMGLMLSQRDNIHFHVWDYPAMMELFSYVTRAETSEFGIEMSALNGSEVIWILRRK
ncbi:MAG TPA: methyltransferase domain-containing protein [Aliidongia sp.]|uniref:methyltransferase domain-containing protein n=1 Tax=Aliidongia sp. TaxID=1914230 RepID=UPI002DDD629C|nr:methyltransferase domain-containing protein [Aliidongia sp.]HEV2676336.1 methyltransferase domain-containing protein [Aliidongia sp.]